MSKVIAALVGVAYGLAVEIFTALIEFRNPVAIPLVTMINIV